ncbi:MAG: hypothetical protein ACRD2Y_07735 [Terriglobales bacterium]
MNKSVSHDRMDEAPEAKARWFQSLSLQQRMQLLCSFCELALSINPGLAEQRHAQPAQTGIRVLRKA